MDLLAVPLEPGSALLDKVELLLAVLLGLIMLVDQPVARLAPGERVGAEGQDAEVLPDRPPGTASVGDLVDLVELRNGVAAHPPHANPRFRGGGAPGNDPAAGRFTRWCDG